MVARMRERLSSALWTSGGCWDATGGRSGSLQSLRREIEWTLWFRGRSLGTGNCWDLTGDVGLALNWDAKRRITDNR